MIRIGFESATRPFTVYVDNLPDDYPINTIISSMDSLYSILKVLKIGKFAHPYTCVRAYKDDEILYQFGSI